MLFIQFRLGGGERRKSILKDKRWEEKMAANTRVSSLIKFFFFFFKDKITILLVLYFHTGSLSAAILTRFPFFSDLLKFV